MSLIPTKRVRFETYLVQFKAYYDANPHISQMRPPAIQFPRKIRGSAVLNLISKSPASIEPVHTPVVGNGIATNSIKNHTLYFSIRFPLRNSRLCCQFPNLLTSFILLFIIEFNALRVNKIIPGENNIDPKTAKRKHSNSGMPKLIPTGIAPLSSIIGTAESPSTIK